MQIRTLSPERKQLRNFSESWARCRNGRQKSSNVKFEDHHIAVGHDVRLSFHAVQALFPSCRNGTALHQILVSDGFRLDEATFEVRMNDACGFRCGIADRDG